LIGANTQADAIDQERNMSRQRPNLNRAGYQVSQNADSALPLAQDDEKPNLSEILAQASVTDLSESPLEWIWTYREIL
jgi:hypothetical protein